MKKAALLCLFAALLAGACSRKPEYPVVSAAGGVVRIESPSSRPAFYSFLHEGKRIDFFVLTAGGAAEAYLDACRKCYPRKLGYRAEGQELVCRLCGVRYPRDGLQGVGSCRPIPLKGRQQGEGFVIDKADLIRGAAYF